MKRLPRDRFTVVVRRLAEIDVTKIHGKLLQIYCTDCEERLTVDDHIERFANDNPERETRQLRWICQQCFTRYEEFSR